MRRIYSKHLTERIKEEMMKIGVHFASAEGSQTMLYGRNIETIIIDDPIRQSPKAEYVAKWYKKIKGAN